MSGKIQVLIIYITGSCKIINVYFLLGILYKPKHFKVKKQSSPATCHGSAWGERKYSSYSFLTLALDGDEWSALRPDRALPPGKDPDTHCTGGWVALRAGVDIDVRGKIL
jgi:hypothetical protein